MRYQPERALKHITVNYLHVFDIGRNEISAREGIETDSIDFLEIDSRHYVEMRYQPERALKQYASQSRRTFSRSCRNEV